jgi:Fe2+ or Zn2+ uptake regulation protein
MIATMHPLEQLAKALKQHGQSLTVPRRTVFKALQGQEPLTMHELVRLAGSVDRASVYRTVALFEQLGIIERLQTGWKYKLELSDDYHEHHHHATCLLCGTSLVVPEDTAIEHHLQHLARSLGFQLERHQLELQGYCEKCQGLLQD